nr:MAG TPA: hypothetical protein [Caudoviricetes sp.]
MTNPPRPYTFIIRISAFLCTQQTKGRLKGFRRPSK